MQTYRQGDRILSMEWKNLIKELLDSGMTQTEIAKAVGTVQSTVSRMKDGHHPKVEYSVGAKLIQLHAHALRLGVSHA